MNSEPAEPVCEICGGMGIVGVKVPVGHPDFGKAFPCVCQAEKIKQRKAKQLLAISNMDAYQDKTFANFEINHALVTSEEEFPRDVFADSSDARAVSDQHAGRVKTAPAMAFRFTNQPDI